MAAHKKERKREREEKCDVKEEMRDLRLGFWIDDGRRKKREGMMRFLFAGRGRGCESRAVREGSGNLSPTAS